MGDNFLDNYSPFDDPSPIAPVKMAIAPAVDEEDDEEIREYERRLDILENRLKTQETQLAVAQETGTIEPPPNWPKFYPMVHYDIDEVPPSLQQFAHEGMFAWCVMAVAFAINWIACLTLLQSGDVVSSPGSKISLSSLYLFVVVPLALNLSALSVYKVLKSEPSTFKYLKVFLALGITTVFEAILTIGLDSSGSVGLITTISLFVAKYWIIGIVGLIATCALGMACMCHLKLVSSLWKYYRGTDTGSRMDDDIKKSLAVMVVEALNKNSNANSTSQNQA